MTTSPITPRTAKGGIVLLDATSGSVQRVISLQYNPDSVARSLQARGAGGETGDWTEALRLTGPPVETITLDAELDATDQLEFPDVEANATVVEVGLAAQLAALETVLYPSSDSVQSNHDLAASGQLEIVPATAPLTVFVWSKNRIVPVKLTEFSITEEAFDVNLNPIRARVHLGMRVLSVNDVGLGSAAGGIFMAYHQQKETLSGRATLGSFEQLGIGGVS